MSTKTTFKRIALVAVAALGAGVLSVAPANAVAATATPFGVSAASYAPADSFAATVAVSQVAGANNFVEFTSGIDGASAVHVVKVTGSTVSSITTGSSLTAGSLNTAATEITYADGNFFTTGTPNVVNTFRVATPTAGTVTVVVATRATSNGVVTDTTLQTFTVTVTATAVTGVVTAANSTSIVSKGTDFTGATADEAVSSSNIPSTPVQAASILVTAKDANGVAKATAPITATISGPGLLGINADETKVLIADTAANARAVSLSDAVNGIAVITVAGDGTGLGGVATITISSGTTVLATETVTFFGKVTSLKVAQVAHSIVDTGSGDSTISGDKDGVVATVTGIDAQGTEFALSGSDFTAITSAALVAADVTAVAFGTGDGDPVAATAAVVVDPTATKTGAKSIVITHTATGVTATVSFVVALASSTTVTLKADKDEYSIGEKVTLTVKAVDATGLILPDGTYSTLFAGAMTSSTGLQGTLPAASVDLVNGVATYTVYAPLTSGPVVITGTEGATSANTTKATVSTTFNVVGDGVAQAAADAAAEATDAANAATDAANAAAEAADAATAAAQDAADAVAALSTQVSEMINALKKQITALTNLVIKIQKKVKA
jgi:hypothetical protein